MAQYLAPEQLENSSGVPLNGGKKHVYQVATTTPLSLFSDEALSTPVANPIVADASGAFAGVFLAETKCKQIIMTSADVTVFTRAVDYTIGVTNTIAAVDVSYDNNASGLAAENLQEAIDETVQLQGSTQSWESAADGVIATGTSTNTGAAGGPDIDLYRNSASPANSDVIGGIRLSGENSAGDKIVYAKIQGKITDTTNGSENGQVEIVTKTNAADDTPVILANSTVDASNGFFEGGVRIGIRPGTAVTASGASVDFTSISAGAKRITLMFADLSTNGTSIPIVQIGDSGGVEITGYSGTTINFNVTDSDVTAYSSGFAIEGTADSAATWVRHGTVTLNRLNSATNTWVATVAGGRSDASEVMIGGGSKALSATLDRVRLTTANGTDTFDAGTVNVLVE